MTDDQLRNMEKRAIAAEIEAEMLNRDNVALRKAAAAQAAEARAAQERIAEMEAAAAEANGGGE